MKALSRVNRNRMALISVFDVIFEASFHPMLLLREPSALDRSIDSSAKVETMVSETDRRAVTVASESFSGLLKGGRAGFQPLIIFQLNARFRGTL
jgi:hypothetical protein